MIKSLPLAIILFVAPVALFPTRAQTANSSQTSSDSAATADLAQTRERFALSVLPDDPAAIDSLRSKSAQLAATETAEGCWTDVDYGDSAQPFWPATEHLQRILTMAKTARLIRDAGHTDAELEKKILLAFHWWTSHDYQNHQNPALWWWNEIGVPELIGESANLMWAQLPPDEIAKIAGIMKRADWQHGPVGRSIGANLIWKVTIEIARGLIENNAATVAEGYARMYEEIKVVGAGEEGIQPDASFHQHGHQLYSGGYGLSYANDVGRFIYYAWGTRFQIPADRMAIFSSYLLDGEAWVIRGTIIDYSTVGREITRPGKAAVPPERGNGPISPAGAAYSLGHVIALLATQPTPRQKELQAFSERLLQRPDASALAGNKQFWCSDFMAHRRAGYSASVKMMSTRIRNAELVNSEGKKSHHLSDGVNFLYLTGNEYKDIFPVWDWTRLPGTTAIADTLDTGEKNPIGDPSTTTFDGGVSDGMYGMAAMDVARGKLTAKKAWFFFDTGYVALGAGITLAGDTEHEVATDVNQLLLNGDVMTSKSRGPLAQGMTSFNTPLPVWVYHDHVGYVFAPNTSISISAGPQTGKWSDIGFSGPKEAVTVPVFNLWINHGRAPQDATYEYTVLPGVKAAEMMRLAKTPELTVLSNTTSIQAVYNGKLKLAEIAFRQAGSLDTPLGRITADHACLLMVRNDAGHFKATASNPENQPLMLHVEVAGRRSKIVLPGGDMAGSSVSVEM